MRSPVAYTDIDYIVYSDAAAHIAQGRSPYERSTYRYSPFLAAVLLPNIFLHPAWGKALFCAADILIAWSIEGILLKLRASPARVRTALALSLFNPFTFSISTRGSADSLSTLLVLSVLRSLVSGDIKLAAIAFGAAVHCRIFPIIYTVPVLLALRTKGALRGDPQQAQGHNTLVFVAFNPVVTAQYFAWYFSLLPLATPWLQAKSVLPAAGLLQHRQARLLLRMATDKSDYVEEDLSPGQLRIRSDLKKFQGNKDKILLRNEVISAAESRLATSCSRLFTLLGVAFLLADLIVKYKKDNTYFLGQAIPITNVCVATICLGCLLLAFVPFFIRLVHVTRNRKIWTVRRQNASLSSFAILLAQIVNVTAWLAINAHVVSSQCGWFSPTIQWLNFTSWSSYNVIFLMFIVQAHNIVPWDPPPEKLKKMEVQDTYCYIDGPITMHIYKLAIWGSFQGIVLALAVYLTTNPVIGVDIDQNNGQNIKIDKHNCPDIRTIDCSFDRTSTSLTAVTIGILVIYCGLWGWYMALARMELYKRSYHRYRVANLVMRIYRRSRAWALAFFAISIVLIFYVRLNTCSAYIETFLGLGPINFILTGLALTSSFLTMPIRPGIRPEALQTLLEQFSWMEADKAGVMSTRNFGHSAAVTDQPMFCFETCIKLFYWSTAVYAFKEDWDGADIETALNLYKLDHFELLWAPAEDTKCIMAWNRDTIVLAFRGTASLSNVLADLQAWTTHMDAHLPHKLLTMRASPAVHNGFLKSWRANDLHLQVLDMVKDIVKNSLEVSGEHVKIYLTGHSLGGALATLAAHDLRKGIPELSSADIICYTFGAPRTGNHAFAKEYNKTVPDTWGLINDQDAVARGGKFLTLFKRPGQRVIINHYGDLIVRPGFAEASFQRVLFGSNVRHHFLASYRQSLARVCLAQFHDKGFPHGSAGVQRLMTHGSGKQVLGAELRQLRSINKGPLASGVKAFEEAILEDVHLKKANTIKRVSLDHQSTMPNHLLLDDELQECASQADAADGSRHDSLSREDGGILDLPLRPFEVAGRLLQRTKSGLFVGTRDDPANPSASLNLNRGTAGLHNYDEGIHGRVKSGGMGGLWTLWGTWI
ncbi:hypothetical protein WJX73_010334 [Symbiochloris irregularis]|uniref:GPI mannosyltransferase I n=1 Tax=Symbiochloris irregularis TaxID=706552 RepID=A0AAW1Q023_9CHLO